MYYVKQIEKINRTRDWRAAAFWLERHEEEFPEGERRATIINQVGINMGGKPKITLDPESLRALSAAYDAEHGERDEPKNTNRE